MKLSIIGASSGVGFETLKLAIKRGFEVTTLSRNPIELEKNANWTMLKGNALNKDDLNSVIQNADAVIVSLGTGKSMKPTSLYTDFATTLLELQKQNNYQMPFIFLTGFGTGDSGLYNTFIMKLFFKFLLKDIYDNKTQMENMISSSSIKWEMVRPGLLKDGDLTQKYRIETKLYKGINIGGINRIDVADFMLNEAQNPKYLKQYPALSQK